MRPIVELDPQLRVVSTNQGITLIELPGFRMPVVDHIDGAIGPSSADKEKSRKGQVENPLRRFEHFARGVAQAIPLVIALNAPLPVTVEAHQVSDKQEQVSSISSAWKPVHINSAIEAEFNFQGIPFDSLDQVARIYSGGDPNNRASDRNNWDWLRDSNGNLLEGHFAAKLKEDPNFNDTFISMDGNSVAEGYQLLVDPSIPSGFREQRIVVGPGQQGIWVKGILVRRDNFPDSLYKYVLTKKTSDTISENSRNGTNITVVGIDGFGGAGALSEGFSPLTYASLDEVARLYGGVASDYDWLRDQNGNALGQDAARTVSDRLRLFLFGNWDRQTVFVGNQPLWSPGSTRTQLVVVNSNGVVGLYALGGTFFHDAKPDVLYKYSLGTLSANTMRDNFQNGKKINVIGVNGFRGGEN